ncbi:MAG: N-acetyltransferase [Actinomycetota bacterium]|nr:N-acetyltransferase [Actinomycetota bacterium]
MSQLKLRDEQAADIAAIARVTIAAFADEPHSDQTEQFVIAQLRARGELTLSIVATIDEQVVGQITASPVQISGGQTEWYGLGPLSVEPALQGIGVGSALMHEALVRLRAIGAQGCVLLGDAAYYSRFGFQVRPELTYPGGPPEHFQAIRLLGDFAHGVVTYSPAFQAQSQA